MKKPVLITGALVLAIGTILGWSFELPRLEETVGAYNLLFRGSLLGVMIGLVVGLTLAIREKSFIAKFQAFGTSFLLFTILFALLAHFTNRVFSTEEITAEHMPVKQVTATWKDRGLSRNELSSPPDGYYIFVETDEGTIRLFRQGSEAPDIGPSRTMAVSKQVGFWGYPRFSISSEED